MDIAQLDSKLIPKFDVAFNSDSEVNKNNKTESFMDILKGALGEVNTLQNNAADSAEKLALGDEGYLHTTMIAYEKASLALQLTVEVRNRVIEAYQEIMRMQM